MSGPAGVPVIDVGPLRTGDSRADAVARVAQAMDAACRDTGFFCVTGHGVDAAALASLDAARRAGSSPCPPRTRRSWPWPAAGGPGGAGSPSAGS